MRVVTASMAAYFALGRLRRQTAARMYSAFSAVVSSRHSFRTSGFVQVVSARGIAVAAAVAAREKRVRSELDSIVERTGG